jgi:SAM-dependent methyltransferase
VMKLNLGSGPVQPAGWLNVDGSNRAWLTSKMPWLDRALVRIGVIPPTDFSRGIVYANLLKRFPWEDGTVDAVYMGEILEHFTLDEARHVVAECCRVLKRGGILRIRVPDHARFWGNYIRDYEAMRERPRDHWSLAHTKWTEMSFETICVARPKLWQSMGHFHKWMYDDISLILLLESLGFQDVGRKGFHDSAIAGIDAVEVRDDLIVEGTRP